MNIRRLPFEWTGGGVVGFNKPVNGLTHLPWGGETGPTQGRPPQQTQECLYLVEPGCVSGGKMKMDVRVTFEPPILFRFMDVQVIQNHVDFLLFIDRHHLIHEVEKLPTAPTLVMPHLDQPCGRFQGYEQGGGPMAGVFVAKPGQRLAIGQPKPSLSPLKGLDARFFIYADNHPILRWIKVKTDDGRRLRSKLRICADQPAATPGKGNAVLAENPPNMITRHISHRFGQERSRPRGIPLRRRRVQHDQDASFGLVIILGNRSWSDSILESQKPFGLEPAALLGDRGRTGAQLHRNLPVLKAPGRPLLRLPRARPRLQGLLFFRRKNNGRGDTTHGWNIYCFANYCK